MEKLFPVVRKMIRLLHLEKWLWKDKKTLEMVELLHRRQDKKKIFIEIWCRRILMLAAGVGITILFFVVSLNEERPADVIVDGHYLQKGEDETLMTFDVEAKTEEGPVREEITVDLGEKETVEEAPEETPNPKGGLLTESAHGTGKVGSVPQESPPRPLQTAGLGAGAHTIVPILLRPT